MVAVASNWNEILRHLLCRRRTWSVIKVYGSKLTRRSCGLSVQERRLRWLVHVQRTSDDEIAKQVLQWIPEERRQVALLSQRGRAMLRVCQ